jgi:hypothetical protein
VAYEKLTVSSTALALSASVYQRARSAIIRIESDSVRYRLDGVAPTATDGILMNAGDVLVLSDPLLVHLFRVIRVSGDAVLHAAYMVDAAIAMSLVTPPAAE